MQQVLLDREAREQLAAFGHHGDAHAHDLVRGEIADRLAVELDHLGPAMKHAHHGAQECRLAGAVGADDGHRLAFVHRDVDVEQRLEIAVESAQPARTQQGHEAGMPI